MKLAIITAIFCLVVTTTYAANGGGCVIDNVSDDDWEFGVFTRDQVADTDPITHRLKFQGDLTVLENSGDFFTVSIEEEFSQILIQSKEDRPDIDAVTPKTAGTTTTISTTMVLKCKDGNSTLEYIQLVHDKNTHEPEFDQLYYQFYVPPGSIDNSEVSFGDELIVSDLDFSNQDIVWEVRPAGYVTITTEVLEDKKYRGIVNVEDLDEDILFGIELLVYAHDTGTDPGSLAGYTTINIEWLDEESARKKQ